jgi:hypothetical protein
VCPSDGAPYFDRAVVGAAEQLVAVHRQGKHKTIGSFESARMYV